jgi:alginate O-acetyltransferase complex protein AlgI
MFNEFNSTSYFVNLLALSILLIPLFFVPRWAFLKRLILIFSGGYLLYFIAPRLLLFYLFFSTCMLILQTVVAVTMDRRGGVQSLGCAWCLR